MKKICFLLIILLIGTSLFASFPVNIYTSNTTESIKQLNKKNISIDKVESNIIRVYVDEEQMPFLQSCGYFIERLPNRAKDYAMKLQELTRNSDNPMRNYYSYDEYIQFMNDISEEYPEIVELENVGYSVQNREILFMKISDNANINEAEPEVKFVSTMHGDESVGTDLCIRLIDLLTSEYGIDDRITAIVDNTELYINPLMNPDGYVAAERMNANGVDLNRSFPNFETDPNNTIVGREPEIAAIMEQGFARNYSLALNFHTGALVMNYPYDTIYDLAPDDALLQDLALAYSHPNTPMYTSPVFEDGITNGAAWYVATGSMQDWNYYYMKNMAMTAEVSNVKWPPANQLDGLWEDNQESMIAYIEKAQTSIGGIIQNDSNQPLSALIVIEGIDNFSFSDSQTGAYNRLLLPGNYEVEYSAFGHISQMHPVEVENGIITQLDIVLEEKDQYEISGLVRDANYNVIEGATITIENMGETQTDQNGFYTFAEIYEGLNQVEIFKEGFGRTFAEIDVSEEENSFNFVLYYPAYQQDFSTNQWETQWNSNSWNVVDNDGNDALTDSPDGEYQNNQFTTAELSSPLDLSISSYCSLKINARYEIEAGYDYCYLQVSDDGNQWETVATFSGFADWSDYSYNIDDYIGGNLYLRLALDTDQSVTEDGFFLNSITVESDNQVAVIEDEENAPILQVNQSYPNPFIKSIHNKATIPFFSSTKNDESVLNIYNLKGQLVNVVHNNNEDVFRWNGKNRFEKSVASGVYFYQIVSHNKKSNMKKMIVIH